DNLTSDGGVDNADIEHKHDYNNLENKSHTHNHNTELTNLQGGTSSGRYHLSQAEYNLLTDNNGSVDNADSEHKHNYDNLDKYNSFLLFVKGVCCHHRCLIRISLQITDVL
ncbi:MAG: hypothetical protein ACP5I1_17500, partial [Candidatus Hinthialibacter sp.]